MEVAPTFRRASYSDSSTGKTLPYIVFLPAGYGSAKQADVKQILTTAGVSDDAAEWDATCSASKLATAAKALLSGSERDHFVRFRTGTVLTTNPDAGSEHMASFEPAYKITAARDWLIR